MTLLVPLQICAHRYKSIVTVCAATTDTDSNGENLEQQTKELWQTISYYLLATNIVINIVGYIFLILLYRHSVQTIFNRKIPTLATKNNILTIRSFNTHLLLLRPLEILFRFLTAPLRVLPDVIILGETRCGTTTLCSHIASLSTASSAPVRVGKNETSRMRIKCYTPFCPWAHPELDHKESFYFVGHYLGVVDPNLYRMAFPLKITRWWEERIMGNMFFCFDGCAQYLTSPTAPYLIASAYQNNWRRDQWFNKNRREELPPILVACVRNPVEQATSWWKFENNAISWGETMGLDEWNTDLRSANYPPKTLTDALKFSMSEFVEKAYSDAEKLVEPSVQHHGGYCEGRYSSTRGSPIGLAFPSKFNVKCLPSWAITWPAGQLSAVGRSGCYSSNIRRYNRIFSLAFRNKDENNSQVCSKENGDLCTGRCQPVTQNQFVHVIPLETQSNGTLLRTSIRPFLSDIAHRAAQRRQQPYPTLVSAMDHAVNQLCMGNDIEMTHRNLGTMLVDADKEPSEQDLTVLKRHFYKEAKEMELILGKKICW